MKLSKLATFSVPILLSLGILVICYPGFMSYDSIRMLEEARSSVRGGIFPAAPVYILRLFDITGHGLPLMLQAQNFITLLSLALILRMIGAGLITSVISILSVVMMPTVIGCMLVLWKDVTLTSLMMFSVTMIFWASQEENKDIYYQVAKWASLLLLIVGTWIRLNAITSTVILVSYWLIVFCKSQGWKVRAVIFISIVICMVASNKVINTYGFPSFHKLESNNIVLAIIGVDLIGISGWSRVSLVPINSAESVSLPKIPISDIDRIYSSLGGQAMKAQNRSLGNIVTINPMKLGRTEVVNAWLAAITDHPIAYMRFRWDLFSEIIGAKNHATYEPTHFNRIDKNPFGIEFQDRRITNITLEYIRLASNSFLGKPWFIFLLSSLSVFFTFRNSFIRREFKIFSYCSYVAALLYILPFLIISGTGEVRYCFPSIVLCSNSIFIWIFLRKQKHQDANV